MLQSFVRQQNFQAVVESPDIPPELADLQQAFRKHFKSDNRGTWAEQVSNATSDKGTVTGPGQPNSLSLRHFERLTSWITAHDPVCDSTGLVRHILEHKEASYFGRRFVNADHDQSPTYSTVVMADGRAGYIKQLFVHSRISDDRCVEQLFAVVRRAGELSVAHQHLDAFRRFPRVTGRLVYTNHDDSVIVPISQLFHCNLHLVPELTALVGRDVLCVYPLIPKQVEPISDRHIPHHLQLHRTLMYGHRETLVPGMYSRRLKLREAILDISHLSSAASRQAYILYES